jgi:hypothetical protein
MFRELYYWMYMTLKKIRTNDTPAFNASLLLCILPPERRTKGQIYFWLYVVLSLVIFFAAGINPVTPKY